MNILINIFLFLAFNANCLICMENNSALQIVQKAKKTKITGNALMKAQQKTSNKKNENVYMDFRDYLNNYHAEIDMQLDVLQDKVSDLAIQYKDIAEDVGLMSSKLDNLLSKFEQEETESANELAWERKLALTWKDESENKEERISGLKKTVAKTVFIGGSAVAALAFLKSGGGDHLKELVVQVANSEAMESVVEVMQKTPSLLGSVKEFCKEMKTIPAENNELMNFKDIVKFDCILM